jgi:hypothetical protein
VSKSKHDSKRRHDDDEQPKAVHPRRAFLKGAGGAALAMPFLESLLPRTASAQALTPPKRFIVLKTFSTQLVQEWYPRFTGNGYQLKDSKYSGSKADGTTLLTQKLVSGKNYTWAPLTDFQTTSGISGILGPALNPFLPKLTLIRGLDFLPAVNHNYGGLLGNFSSCTAATPCDADSLTDVPTIDQVMAYSPKVYASTPGLRYLHISQGVTDSMSYSNLGMAGAPCSSSRRGPIRWTRSTTSSAPRPARPPARTRPCATSCWSTACFRTTHACARTRACRRRTSSSSISTSRWCPSCRPSSPSRR